MGRMAATERTGNKQRDLEAFVGWRETINTKRAKFKNEQDMVMVTSLGSEAAESQPQASRSRSYKGVTVVAVQY